MNQDIRLNVGFFAHRKTLALAARLGDSGVVALQRLWCWAACFRPNGDLVGLDGSSIESAAGWRGQTGALLAALREIGWVDGADSAHSLRNWRQYQGWVSHAKQRSESARKSANRRWEKVRQTRELMRNASNSGHTAPSPSPSRTTRTTISSASRKRPAGVAGGVDHKRVVDAFHGAYLARFGRPPTWGDKQGKMVKLLLAKHDADDIVHRIEILSSGAGPAFLATWDLGSLVQHYDLLAEPTPARGAAAKRGLTTAEILAQAKADSEAGS